MAEYHRTAVTACNADISVARLAYAVHNTAHNGYLDILVYILGGFLNLFCKTYKVYPSSSAGRAGNYPYSAALADSL